ncbi:hypothetical protein GCM10027589_07280 [Actinocorallia lasiicapitis]
MSNFSASETCPFEDPLIIRDLAEPVATEPFRRGEGSRPCMNCSLPDSTYIWTDDRWRIRAKDPTSLPGTVILETRDHYDSFMDLPGQLVGEFGPLAARVERAIMSITGIARVHALRWGDGNAHFHMYFYARPYGQMQLRGTFMEIWELLLPEASADIIRTSGAHIAHQLHENQEHIEI